MTDKPDIDIRRRELLGQMEIVRMRMTRLAEVLVSEPSGVITHPEETIDALGNLSFQIGGLMALVNKYQEVVPPAFDPRARSNA